MAGELAHCISIRYIALSQLWTTVLPPTSFEPELDVQISIHGTKCCHLHVSSSTSFGVTTDLQYTLDMNKNQ